MNGKPFLLKKVRVFFAHVTLWQANNTAIVCLDECLNQFEPLIKWEIVHTWKRFLRNYSLTYSVQ